MSISGGKSVWGKLSNGRCVRAVDERPAPADEGCAGTAIVGTSPSGWFSMAAPGNVTLFSAKSDSMSAREITSPSAPVIGKVTWAAKGSQAALGGS